MNTYFIVVEKMPNGRWGAKLYAKEFTYISLADNALEALNRMLADSAVQIVLTGQGIKSNTPNR